MTQQSKPNNQNQIFGRYHIQEELGRGGMGVVYKAYDTQLKRMVALKVLLNQNSKIAEQRFFREAQAMAQMKHNNIIGVIDVGSIQSKAFFTMDFICGQPLNKILKKLSSREVAKLMSKIAHAIHYAHEQGVIHRDLKPSNIMVDNNNEPIVLDFGLAKMSKNSKELSKTGDILGTLLYMSPEQATGKTREIDHLSDVYSLGAILYSALTGKTVFSGGSPANILYKISYSEPRPLRSLVKKIPQNLEIICLKTLEKKKENRYQSALELANDLERFINGEPIHAQPISLLTSTYRKMRSRKMYIPLFIGIIVGLLGFLYQKNLEQAQQKKQDKQKIEQLQKKLQLQQKKQDKIEHSQTKRDKTEANLRHFNKKYRHFLDKNGTLVVPRIDEINLQELAEIYHPQQFTALALSSNKNINDKNIAIISQMSQLKVLNLKNTTLTDACLVHVAKISSLENLGLNNTKVYNGSPHLLKLKNLKVLYLNQNSISTTFTEHIKKLNIEILSLRNTQIKDFSFLQNMTSLRHLSLKNTSFSNIGYLKKLVHLEILGLSYCRKLDNNSFREIIYLKNLNTLHAPGCYLNSKALNSIAKLNLKICNLDPNLEKQYTLIRKLKKSK
ncbi:protein kinase [Candidatus Uabimicrobium sp. HlEnr_7]|uniref:protein kinase domain-containing protein n=1 Tax=Candidatus Uabimicrobium helgolandensis TaxID=3095367 RepID=UPI0035582895